MPLPPRPSHNSLLGLGVVAVAVLLTAGCRSDIVATDADASPLPPGQLTDAQLVVLTAGDPEAPADLRREAYRTLSTSTAAGEPVYLDFYRATLADHRTDPTVATVCAAALAKYGQPADAPAIALLLDNDEPFVRWQAAVSLQRLHNPEVVPALVRAVAHDLDADTRQAAAEALGQYPRRDVYDALLTALDDRDYGVTLAARQTLERLTNHLDAGEDPRAWLDHANAHPAALFDDAQPYTYSPYPPKRTFFEVLLFQPRSETSPRSPRGYSPP